jgi:cadmium resistance protein CadD (predicted permease)
MFANSGDSLAVLAPLFAETREPYTLLIVGAGISMVLLWSGLAGWIARSPALAEPIRKWSAYLLPLILIAVGLYILSDTGTDTL